MDNLPLGRGFRRRLRSLLLSLRPARPAVFAGFRSTGDSDRKTASRNKCLCKTGHIAHPPGKHRGGCHKSGTYCCFCPDADKPRRHYPAIESMANAPRCGSKRRSGCIQNYRSQISISLTVGSLKFFINSVTCAIGEMRVCSTIMVSAALIIVSFFSAMPLSSMEK